MTQLSFFAKADATLSPCGRYRYRLRRVWDSGPTMLFVMLNPSTADASEDDPTVTRCLGFAKRERCGTLEIVNLFARRATDPRKLAEVADPIGPGNDRAIAEAAERADRIVVAWGTHVPTQHRERPVHVLELLAGRDLFALGVTKRGHPRHPLYLAADAPLVRFKGDGAP